MVERLFPDMYLKRVEDINLLSLKERGIKGLIIDIDNTLIDYDRRMRKSTETWIIQAKEMGLKVYLVSNNVKSKVFEISDKLSVEAIHSAAKPRRKGFLEAIRKMGISNTEVAVVGDQIFTDIYGGNRLNMLTILVEQISIKDIWITKIKRPLEKYILEKYASQSKKQSSKKLLWKKKSAFQKKL